MSKLLRQLNDQIDTISYEGFICLSKQISESKIKPKELRSHVSLIIKYHMINQNFSEVEKIIAKETNLMKRDYLLYLTHLYKVNYAKAIDLFKSIIPKYQFLDKDIEYIFEHKMNHLFYFLENYYLSLKTDINHVADLRKMNHINPISDENKSKMLSKIVDKFKSPAEKTKLDDFLKDVDIVIDGGNIAYFMGQGNPNYKYFHQIITMVKKKYRNALLIIHPRHLKNKIVKDCLAKSKIRYFLTSRGTNDDHYIVYSIIKNDCDVITLDNYKDHIFDLSVHIGDMNNIVRNYIDEKIINYTQNSLKPIPKYSKCIQIDSDKKIYVPTNLGFIILT